MKERKYTLPRRTNLAKQGSRIGAFIIDLAIFIAITLVFYFSCFNLAFKSVTAPKLEALHQEEINSHLRYQKEDGTITQIASNASYEEYTEVLTYYFFNYLTGEGIDESVACKDDINNKLSIGGLEFDKREIDVVWYNQYILKIDPNTNPDDNSSVLFTYVLDGEGNQDKTKVGVPKSEDLIKVDSVNVHMQQAFAYAYSSFAKLDYYYSLNNRLTFILTVEFVLSSIIALGLTYIMFPFIFGSGVTCGKKIFKLALANSDGYVFDNKKLFMRAMPSLVVILAMLLPLWSSLAVLLIVLLTVFLVSFAFTMASPKRMSLHDFTAQSIVIDAKTSMIFVNQFAEDEYLRKEEQENNDKIDDGEEPTISYER